MAGLGWAGLAGLGWVGLAGLAGGWCGVWWLVVGGWWVVAGYGWWLCEAVDRFRYIYIYIYIFMHVCNFNVFVGALKGP